MASTTPTRDDPALRGWLEALAGALAPMDHAPLECDGMTCAISNLLQEAGIDHRACVGYVEDVVTGDVVTPHCWIAFEGGWLLDYRLRMWLGDHRDVPHGLVPPNVQQRYQYAGERYAVPNLPEGVLALMTDGRSQQLSLPSQAGLQLDETPTHAR